MKKISLLFALAIGVIGGTSFINTDDGGLGKTMPSVMLENLDGDQINSADLENGGNPIVISFWATWCKPCRLELNTIMDEYDELVSETGVKLVAVSIDDERNKSKVRPVVDAEGWDYDVWLDTNSDLKRAMGVNYPPQTFILNGEGKIVYSHVGFVPGDELDLFDAVRALSE
ncbi:MAG: cytochrome c biogenesis protein CcmG/thiol:disulfide interchange protein DsbE [Crocinitomix sp.]|jgi:cytochrome c biogenesis protein CcmG/thiol:disulfide interchange protein DsbE